MWSILLMTRLLLVYSVVLTSVDVTESVRFVTKGTRTACVLATGWMTLVVQYVDFRRADAHLLTKKGKLKLRSAGVVVFLLTNH